MTDSGRGIAAEMLPRIFDLFAQERQEIDRSDGGLGLGLAIVKSLVRAHGGTVEAHSAARTEAPASPSACRWPANGERRGDACATGPDGTGCGGGPRAAGAGGGRQSGRRPAAGRFAARARPCLPRRFDGPSALLNVGEFQPRGRAARPGLAGNGRLRSRASGSSRCRKARRPSSLRSPATARTSTGSGRANSGSTSTWSSQSVSTHWKAGCAKARGVEACRAVTAPRLQHPRHAQANTSYHPVVAARKDRGE